MEDTELENGISKALYSSLEHSEGVHFYVYFYLRAKDAADCLIDEFI